MPSYPYCRTCRDFKMVRAGRTTCLDCGDDLIQRSDDNEESKNYNKSDIETSRSSLKSEYYSCLESKEDILLVYFCGTLADKGKHIEGECVSTLFHYQEETDKVQKIIYDGPGIRGKWGIVSGDWGESNWDSNTDKAIYKILDNYCRSNKKVELLRVIFVGWSRGAVSAILCANKLYNYDDTKIKVDLFLIDPVPGELDKKKPLTKRYAKNVDNVYCYYAGADDYKNKYLFHPLNALPYSRNTVVESYVLPGSHADVSRYGEAANIASGNMVMAHIKKKLEERGVIFSAIPGLPKYNDVILEYRKFIINFENENNKQKRQVVNAIDDNSIDYEDRHLGSVIKTRYSYIAKSNIVNLENTSKYNETLTKFEQDENYNDQECFTYIPKQNNVKKNNQYRGDIIKVETIDNSKYTVLRPIKKISNKNVYFIEDYFYSKTLRKNAGKRKKISNKEVYLIEDYFYSKT